LRSYVAARGKSILLTSHALSEAESLADRVALIHNGRIVLTSTPDSLKKSLGFHGFLEVREQYLTSTLDAELVAGGAIRRLGASDLGWVAYGIPAVPDCAEDILHHLHTWSEPVEFRYRPVTLEDAFVHYMGTLDERFEP
jgi:ABC-type multidrug transport system ATPase subunit